MDSDLVAALRSRGITVLTAFDAGLAERSNEEQLGLRHRTWLCTLHVQCLRFLPTSHALDQSRTRARRDDSDAATAVLGGRAVASHLATFRDWGEHAEQGGVPQQLGLNESKGSSRNRSPGWSTGLLELGVDWDYGSHAGRFRTLAA
jgi:hypothetical protein